MAERANGPAIAQPVAGTPTTQTSASSPQSSEDSASSSWKPARPAAFSPTDLVATPGEDYVAATKSGYKLFMHSTDAGGPTLVGPDGHVVATYNPGAGFHGAWLDDLSGFPMDTDWSAWAPDGWARDASAAEAVTSVQAPPTPEGEAFNPGTVGNQEDVM